MLIAIIIAVVSFPLEVIYWIKWVIAYSAIRVYNSRRTRRFDLYEANADGDPEKLNYLVPQIETDLESPLSETHLQESADEILFYGVNSKSECLLVRITRGCNQEAEAWIYLKLANGKTYQLLEHANYQQPFEEQCLSFTCGNLEMHYLLPMRRWRIQFCGQLKEKSENQELTEDVVFVKFVFLWTACSDVYEPTLDTNPEGFASAIARSDWTNIFYPPIKKLPEAINFYTQIGNLRGTVSVNEGTDYEMYLFGEKMRFLGNSNSVAGLNFIHLMGYVPSNGLAVHLMKSSAPKMFKNLSVGFVLKPDGDMNPIKELDITLQPFSIETAKSDFQASFAAGASYDMTGLAPEEPIILYSGQGWSGYLELSYVNFTINNKNGYGLFFSGEVYNESKKISPSPLRMLFPKVVPLTVKFSEDISQFGDISGGKGSSLGKLTKLSRTNKTFTVPKGIIVTTAAYEAFLTPDIKNAVKELENVVYGNVEEDIKITCEAVSRVVLNTTLPNEITQKIIEDLKLVFGDIRNKKFAVRSSATGEDTDVMSAAGQMDTYLGVTGLQDIFLAVKKCWTSQFGHIAVEYKRQNGQMINSPMAVVIQEMVACEVSGVLFTCDPVNNNPSVITITANYGLGETVVSGSVEPDTIMLHRSTNDHLRIKSVNIGSKHQKIIMQENGGIVTEDLPEDSTISNCISEETALILGKLSIQVEKFYRSSRDIEWGILSGKIYLLQSRPVTSGGTATDFELKHEFDSPLQSERDYLTVANIGEVMPDVTTPLGMDVISKFFQAAFGRAAFENGQKDSFSTSTYFSKGIQTFYNHMMLGVIEFTCRQGRDNMFMKGLMISIFGRFLNDPELHELTKERVKESPKSTLWGDFEFIKDLLFYNWNIEKVKKKIYNYDLPYLKCKTAEETFATLLKAGSEFHDAPIQHIRNSENSSNWNIIMFMILVKVKGRFDRDVYSDFGRLLSSSCNLESADIPSSMQEVANEIVKDLGADKFKAMSLVEAENWLNTTNTSSGLKFRQFIKRHGHRCLSEFDVYSTTWGEDQKLLINLLQALAGSNTDSKTKEEDNYSKTFSDLRVPLDFFNKLLLRIVIPNCRKGVQSREAGKAILIKSMDHWRKGFRHLGKLMKAEGRIPDTELLYFMTIEEVRSLLKTRYPKIIARANQRRKIFPVLGQYKFPEIIKGFPKPINEDEDSLESQNCSTNLTMQGIPVSQGVSKGYARVATSLEEAAHLKPGEILIAYSTDIGWSPYFPIISGVVTELGGLISHGAVVSREYGLPCVVGLQGATKKFKTGDFVLLDGKKGILQRLPQPSEE